MFFVCLFVFPESFRNKLLLKETIQELQAAFHRSQSPRLLAFLLLCMDRSMADRKDITRQKSVSNLHEILTSFKAS